MFWRNITPTDNGGQFVDRGAQYRTGIFYTSEEQKNEYRAVLEAGSVIILNLNTWHAGAQNFNGKERKTIFIQIKRRAEQQLLNYKKYLSIETKNALNENHKYLLGIRDIDPTQKENSYSVGVAYRKLFGKDRGAIK